MLGLASAAAVVAASVAAAPGAIASDQVPQGIGQAVVQAATVFGQTPPSTPVQVSIILRMRNANELGMQVQTGALRQPMSVSEFADRYGQSPEVIQAITQYLQSFGITTGVYADNLDITAQGTAGEFDQAFSVQLMNMNYHGEEFHGTRDNPRFPGSIASPILAVLGLSNYSGMFVSHAVMAKTVGGTNAQSGSAPPAGMQTPQNLAAHYNVNPLYAAGDYGAGRTIGIVTLASINPSDAFTFWQDIGLSVNPGRLSLVNVDGGAGVPSLSTGSDETTLDVQQSGALAPQANIVVYQAPNTDYGFADAFYQAISSNQVDSLSTSWGESEDAINYYVSQGQESPAYAQAFDQAFLEGAAQGISMFAASGDAGAYDASRDLGTTDLSIDNPASDPYITAAGGTTLAGTQNYGTFSVTVPTERTWGWDYLWPYWQQFGFPNETSWAQALVAGSGGGYSSIFPTPLYQTVVRGVHQYAAVPYLTPTNSNTAWNFNPNPAVTTGFGNGRATPDLAMNADPQTGYAVYSTLFGPAFGGNWVQFGGTSFVAPQLAGITALIDDYVGRRVGFWNPSIYRFATSRNSPFTPLDTTGTSSDNLYYTGRQGATFNPGSGLGIPDFYLLAQDFKGGEYAPQSGNP